MSKSNVLGANLLVQAASKDNALVQQLGQDVGDADTVRQIDGSHGMSLVLGLSGDDLQAEISNSLLDLVGDFDVSLETLRQGTGQNLANGSVQGVDELR